MKSFKFFLLSITLMCFFGNSYSLDLYVNNQSINTSQYSEKPLIIEGRTYVPLRFVSNALDYYVEWDSKNRQVLILEKSYDSIQVPENANRKLRIILNGNPVHFPQDYGAPFINNNSKTMVPLRGISEAMEFKVSFKNNSVYINKDQQIEVSRSNPQESVSPSTSESSHEDSDDVNTSSSQALGKEAFSENLSVMGEPLATEEQLRAFVSDKAKSLKKVLPAEYNQNFEEIPDLIPLYLEIGKEYGIRGDVAYCQALKETHFFQFTGEVRNFQNNYCGLWATGTPLTGDEPFNGVDSKYIEFVKDLNGVSFSSQRVGVEAQIQHLYAYATDKPLPEGKVLLDPRFKYVKRGCAPTWKDLGAKWAVGSSYGQSILNDYLLKVLNY